MTTISITISDSLQATVRNIVEREGMSFEQFILLAMTEKASAMTTETYLEARANRDSKEKFLAAMAKVADVDPPDEQDRI